MFDNTPPTGGHLSNTSASNPGDRIADALASLRRTPAPGWLWALWASANGPASPLVPPPPADVEIVRMGEGVGFDTSPPHYGMVSRDLLPPYGDGGTILQTHGEDVPKGPEMFAGHLVRMFASGTAPEWCMCGACMSTGTPGGLLEYLSTETIAGGLHDASDGGRFTIALEVASARALRAAYIHALRSGKAPAGWLAQAEDPDHPGHYLARMSDTGLAAGMCSLWWWEPFLEDGLTYLYPVEMFAALAQGFAYPVPMPGTSEWRRQATAEERLDGFPGVGLLNHTAEDLLEMLDAGIPPWDGRRCDGVTP